MRVLVTAALKRGGTLEIAEAIRNEMDGDFRPCDDIRSWPTGIAPDPAAA